MPCLGRKGYLEHHSRPITSNCISLFQMAEYSSTIALIFLASVSGFALSVEALHDGVVVVLLVGSLLCRMAISARPHSKLMRPVDPRYVLCAIALGRSAWLARNWHPLNWGY